MDTKQNAQALKLKPVAASKQKHIAATFPKMSIDTFRIGTKQDADYIVQLVNKAYGPEAGLSGWTHESHLVSGNRISPEQIMETMVKPDSVLLVGLKNSEIVA